MTDRHGRPIAGATVVINNAVWYNRNIVLTSDADGRYRTEVPPNDSWYVRGTTTVTFEGREWTLDLKPSYSGGFSGRDGRVVDLVWALTGTIPDDFGHGGFYGGSVEIDPGWDLPDVSGVTVTLTPVGTLIDGLAGDVIRRTAPDGAGSLVLRDVPLGRYAVRVTKDGAPLVMRVRYRSEYVSELTTFFEPAYPGSTSYGIYFSVATAPIP